MLDKPFQKALIPVLQAVARQLVRRGVHADALTWTGFALGLLAAVAVAFELYGAGLALLLTSRFMDGLDGAVARLTQPTFRGGFLDITLDFIFYGAIVLGFALANPQANALSAAVLLAAFIGTGSSFLAFAVVASQAGLPDTAPLRKSFHYLGGLTEATETLAAFAAMCWWPAYFPQIAYGFAALCALTVAVRIHAGCITFSRSKDKT
jgi:phosphatidylglycerophosphate synthase